MSFDNIDDFISLLINYYLYSKFILIIPQNISKSFKSLQLNSFMTLAFYNRHDNKAGWGWRCD